MTVAGAFLGGASGRLLPASVPLRFFGAAVGYHVLGWLVLGEPLQPLTLAGGALILCAVLVMTLRR